MIKFLAIIYDRIYTGEVLVIVSDALFVDDVET